MYLSEVDEENRLLKYKADKEKAIKFKSKDEIDKLSILSKYLIV